LAMRFCFHRRLLRQIAYRNENFYREFVGDRVAPDPSTTFVNGSFRPFLQQSRTADPHTTGSCAGTRALRQLLRLSFLVGRERFRQVIHAMKAAFHALFQVAAFLRRFVDDTSELFDAGC
jgi:hypothetical protein